MVGYLEHRESVHPSDESRQSRFSGTGNTDEQEMTLRLSEDPVDPKDVIENFVEENERHVELFFVEDFESEMKH